MIRARASASVIIDKSLCEAVEKCQSQSVKIRHLYISPGHNFFGHQQQPSEHPTIEVQQIQCVAGRGIRGDRFFDFKKDYKGQVTFFASEVFDGVCRELGASGKSPGATRRNIITADIDLNTLIGKRFEVQGVAFEGVYECAPCHWMNEAIAPGAEASLRGRGGLRARILTDGELRVDPA